MKRKLLIGAMALVLALTALSAVNAQEQGRYTFFDNFDPTTGVYWCYEEDCATTKDTPGLYVTSGQLYVGYYVLKTIIVNLKALASTSLTVRVEGRADLGGKVAADQAWANVWNKTYTAATQGESGSDRIAEVINIAEHYDYLRVGTLVTTNASGDVLYVHGIFKMRN